MQCEMKESGIGSIGVIPNTWNVTCLKRALSAIKDGTHGTYERVASGKMLLSAKNVFDDGIHIGQNESLVSEDDFKEITSSGFPQKGDVLMCIVGTIGRACVYEDNEPIAFQRSVAFLRTNNLILPNFLKYILQSPSTIEEEKLSSNGTAQVGLYLGAVEKLPVILPPISEQQSIVSYLVEKCAAIDEIIAETKATIDEYKSLKASVIFEAVTKGLNPNAEMKDSGVEWIGEIPQKWIAIKFKYLLRIKSGDAIRNETLSETGHYPVYGGGELIGYNNDFNVEKNTILVGRVGARCGCITKISEKAWATDNALIITNKFNGDYIFYLLVAADLNKLNTSNAQPLITATKINNHFTAFTYDSDEQCKIVEYLDEKCAAIDGVIAEKEALIGELENYRKSLIFETVTGKRRVAV